MSFWQIFIYRPKGKFLFCSWGFHNSTSPPPIQKLTITDYQYVTKHRNNRATKMIKKSISVVILFETLNKVYILLKIKSAGIFNVSYTPFKNVKSGFLLPFNI